MNERITEFSALKNKTENQKKQAQARGVLDAIRVGLEEIKHYSENSHNFKVEVAECMSRNGKEAVERMREMGISVLHPEMITDWAAATDMEILEGLSTDGIFFFAFISEEGDEYQLRLFMEETKDAGVMNVGILVFRTVNDTKKMEYLSGEGKWLEVNNGGLFGNDYAPDISNKLFENASVMQQVILERDDAETDLLYILTIQNDGVLSDEEYIKRRRRYLDMLLYANRYDLDFIMDEKGDVLLVSDDICGFAVKKDKEGWKLFQYCEVEDFIDPEMVEDEEDMPDNALSDYKRFIGIFDSVEVFENYMGMLINTRDSHELETVFCLPLSIDFSALTNIESVTPEYVAQLPDMELEHDFTVEEKKNMRRFKNWLTRVADFM